MWSLKKFASFSIVYWNFKIPLNLFQVFIVRYMKKDFKVAFQYLKNHNLQLSHAEKWEILQMFFDILLLHATRQRNNLLFQIHFNSNNYDMSMGNVVSFSSSNVDDSIEMANYANLSVLMKILKIENITKKRVDWDVADCSNYHANTKDIHFCQLNEHEMMMVKHTYTSPVGSMRERFSNLWHSIVLKRAKHPHHEYFSNIIRNLRW